MTAQAVCEVMILCCFDGGMGYEVTLLYFLFSLSFGRLTVCCLNGCYWEGEKSCGFTSDC